MSRNASPAALFKLSKEKERILEVQSHVGNILGVWNDGRGGETRFHSFECKTCSISAPFSSGLLLAGFLGGPFFGPRGINRRFRTLLLLLLSFTSNCVAERRKTTHYPDIFTCALPGSNNGPNPGRDSSGRLRFGFRFGLLPHPGPAGRGGPFSAEPEGPKVDTVQFRFFIPIIFFLWEIARFAKAVPTVVTKKAKKHWKRNADKADNVNCGYF